MLFRSVSRFGSHVVCRSFAWIMLAGVAGCWGTPSEQPPIHLQLNMDMQEKGEAQERNEFFSDHRFMRKPPAGTVALGHLNADQHLYQGLGADHRIADTLPDAIEFDDALLARGEERYNIYCAPCHGIVGRGDGPATRRGGGMSVMPANLHSQFLQPAPVGYFFRVMTYGQGQMRSYAAQVPVNDRWAIAMWVRLLQVSHRASPDDVPAEALTKTARRAP